jgi:hypothetical protein
MENSVDQQLYQEAVGSILYAAITTRPDIAFASGLVGRYSEKLFTTHWQVVKRILRYLKQTRGFSLRLGCVWGSGTGSSSEVTVFADSDFASEVDTMKSTTGIAILDRFGVLVYWKSKRQTAVAKSTADAEFHAMAMVVEEGLWMQKLDGELFWQEGNTESDGRTQTPLKVFNNNQACIVNLSNGRCRPSTRHVGVRYFWLCELTERKEIQVRYVATREWLLMVSLRVWIRSNTRISFPCY